jgi:hypothetical protein
VSETKSCVGAELIVCLHSLSSKYFTNLKKFFSKILSLFASVTKGPLVITTSCVFSVIVVAAVVDAPVAAVTKVVDVFTFLAAHAPVATVDKIVFVVAAAPVAANT